MLAYTCTTRIDFPGVNSLPCLIPEDKDRSSPSIVRPENKQQTVHLLLLMHRMTLIYRTVSKRTVSRSSDTMTHPVCEQNHRLALQIDLNCVFGWQHYINDIFKTEKKIYIHIYFSKGEVFLPM